MNNTMTLILIGIMIIGAGGFVLSQIDNSGGRITTENPTVIGGEVQKVTLSYKNYNYYPQEIRVKAGQPVELTLDESVYGCFRAFTIRDLGVSKISSNPNDKITFVAPKRGTYTFACTMGMGSGRLIVE